MKNYTVLGINAGNGVSLWPFKENLVGNMESRAVFHSVGEKQWVSNYGETPMFKTLPLIYNACEKANVIISNPDCGAGSILRLSVAKEYGDHKDNKSLDEFFEAVNHYRPDFFYFENLPGLWKSFQKEDFKAMLSKYRLVIHEAPVSMWGNSQVNRVRLIIIGTRKRIAENFNYEKAFELPDFRDRNKTCFELYGDLDKVTATPYAPKYLAIGDVRESINEMVTVYSKFKCSINDCYNYWRANPKERRWKVEGRNFTTAPGVYRNRKRDYPATARKANRQFDHNGWMLTPRQLARIQGVTDDFKIYFPADMVEMGGYHKLNYWINKGRVTVTKTPPMEISTWFKTKIEKFYSHG
jgi:site-specific DNA-cytosine methylase